jgi:phosphohistidine phosphatase
MELVLWRHCDAEDGVPDSLRRLTPRGRSDAMRIAHWLAPRLPVDARILVSPAVRAQQTAAALGRAFATVDALAPGAAIDAVLRAAGWPDAPVTTVIVGHEPVLGDVAAAVLDDGTGGRALRKGAVVWLASAAGATGARDATLIASAEPDSVR